MPSNQPHNVWNVILSCESFAHPTMCPPRTWEPPRLSLEMKLPLRGGGHMQPVVPWELRGGRSPGGLSPSRRKSDGPVGFCVSAVDTRRLTRLLAPGEEWGNSSPRF